MNLKACKNTLSLSHFYFLVLVSILCPLMKMDLSEIISLYSVDSVFVGLFEDTRK